MFLDLFSLELIPKDKIIFSTTSIVGGRAFSIRAWAWREFPPGNYSICRSSQEYSGNPLRLESPIRIHCFSGKNSKSMSFLCVIICLLVWKPPRVKSMRIFGNRVSSSSSGPRWTWTVCTNLQVPWLEELKLWTEPGTSTNGLWFAESSSSSSSVKNPFKNVAGEL